MTTPLLQVNDLRVSFCVSTGSGLGYATRNLKAVDGISFDLHVGETLGVVGESGCGKSTLARAVLNLVPAGSGRVMWLGQAVSGLTEAAMRPLRKQMQIIFQDPLASLDPRMTAEQIIAEPLKALAPEIDATQRRRRVADVMARVGLQADQVHRYPHEFSGGQCQRIGIARALVLNPKLIVCDEPVSALDVSIQAQIINLLQDLQRDLDLALIFIAHDLNVVRHISQRVMVMYLGRAVEIAPRDAIYAQPRHPYTRALIDAVPLPDPQRERSRSHTPLTGEVPSPLDPPSGCAFRNRCPIAAARCATETPVLRMLGGGVQVACHFVE